MANDDIQIVGAERLGAVARKLKATGNGGLRKELYAGIQRAAKPLKLAMQTAARTELPKGGGLNEYVANGGFSVSTRSGNDPGVRIKAKKGGGAERGVIRHPVFGKKDVIVEQRVDSGWFSRTGQAGAPPVRQEIVKVLDDVGRQL